MWLGDVPNRYRVSELSKSAQIALLSSDFPAALRAYRAALVLRPGEREMQRQYQDTQERWVQTLERRLEGRSPEQAYAEVRDVPPRLELLLTEPQLGRLRQRVEGVATTMREQLDAVRAAARALAAGGNFEGAHAALQPLAAYPALVPRLADDRRAIEVLQVETAMAKARELAADGQPGAAREILEPVAGLAGGVSEFAEQLAAARAAELEQLVTAARSAAADEAPGFEEAWQALAVAEKRGLAREQVEATARFISERALRHEGVALVKAVVGNWPEEVRAALEGLQRNARISATEADRVQLSATTLEFEPFRTLLHRLQLDRVDDALGYRMDAHLIFAVLDRFKDRSAAEAYLAEIFRGWAKAHAGAGHPAVAQLLDRRAIKLGAPEDAAWSRAQAESIRAQSEVTIAVRSRSPIPASISAAEIARAAHEALRGRERAGASGTWPRVVLSDHGTETAGDAARRITAETVVEVTTSDTPLRVSRSVRYQSGTREVRNPDWDNLIAQRDEYHARFRSLEREVAAAKRRSADAQNNPNLTPNQRVGEVVEAEALALAKTIQMNNARSEGMAIEGQMRNTPLNVTEPVYADEPYTEITRQRRFIAHCTFTFWSGGEEIGTPWTVSAETTRKTFEVVGNASRGVPVRSETAIDQAKLGTELTSALVAKIARLGTLPNLQNLTWAHALRRGAEAADPFGVAEQLLRVASRWEEQGVRFSRQPDAERALDAILFPQ
ncbi:hypothetical protein DB354_03150 [Opitutus sp. ER46]|nr:hypothetical protein DB354_03150 [Opitutus sp. ER46]